MIDPWNTCGPAHTVGVGVPLSTVKVGVGVTVVGAGRRRRGAGHGRGRGALHDHVEEDGGDRPPGREAGVGVHAAPAHEEDMAARAEAVVSTAAVTATVWPVKVPVMAMAVPPAQGGVSM